MKKINDPPKLLSYLLEFIILPEDRESLPGDFAEMYHYISKESGELFAVFCYLFQIFKLIPSFISNSIQWSVIMLKNYLKIALRNIFKHKVFSFINIFGFAISLSLCILVIKLTIFMYSSDRFHKNKDRIYRVISLRSENNRLSEMATAPMPLANELNKLPEVVVLS